jgi:hypothetical protein
MQIGDGCHSMWKAFIMFVNKRETAFLKGCRLIFHLHGFAFQKNIFFQVLIPDRNRMMSSSNTGGHMSLPVDAVAGMCV